MKSLPAGEYRQILELLEKRSRSAAKRYNLSASDVDEMISIGLRVAGQQWPLWVSDSDVTLAAFIWAHARFPITAYVRSVLDRRRQEEDTEQLAEQTPDRCDEAADPRLARLEELADQHLSVRVYLAEEHGEKASATIARMGLKGRRGRGAMAYIDLQRLRDEGRGRVASDPVLRRLSGIAHAEPRPLTAAEIADLEVSAPAHHFRQDSCERRTPCRPRSSCLSASPAGVNRETGAGVLLDTAGPVMARLRVASPGQARQAFTPAGPRPAGCRSRRGRCPSPARFDTGSRLETGLKPARVELSRYGDGHLRAARSMGDTPIDGPLTRTGRPPGKLRGTRWVSGFDPRRPLHLPARAAPS